MSTLIVILTFLLAWWILSGVLVIFLFDFGQKVFNENPLFGSIMLFSYGPAGWVMLTYRNIKRVFNV